MVDEVVEVDVDEVVEVLVVEEIEEVEVVDVVDVNEAESNPTTKRGRPYQGGSRPFVRELSFEI